MWRFCLLIARNLLWFIKVITKMERIIKADLSENERYKYMVSVIEGMKKRSKVTTEVFGTENLPEEGGYVMYPNHQGKYDAFGIVFAHKKPCTVIMDKDKSFAPFIKQVIDLLKGKRLDINNARQGLTIINETAKEVSDGRRYMIFPEGGYTKDKKNSLGEFKAGCFKASLKSKTPIVPVAIVDSYKAWNSSALGEVVTQVHFLEPILYEDYKDLSTAEIARMTKAAIEKKLDSLQ